MSRVYVGVGEFFPLSAFSGISWWAQASCFSERALERSVILPYASLHESFRKKNSFDHCALLLG